MAKMTYTKRLSKVDYKQMTPRQQYKLIKRGMKTDLKAAKIQSAAKMSNVKSVANSLRDTAIAIGSQAIAGRTIDNAQAGKILKGDYVAKSNIDDALSKYMSLMDGNPSKESGENGSKQDGSTTDIPTFSSKGDY